MPANPIFPYAPPLTFVPSIPLATQSPPAPQTESVTDLSADLAQVSLGPTPNTTNYDPTSVTTSTSANTSQDFQKAEGHQTNVNELFASVPASNTSPSLVESFTAPPTSYAQYAGAGAGGIQQHVSSEWRFLFLFLF